MLVSQKADTQRVQQFLISCSLPMGLAFLNGPLNSPLGLHANLMAKLEQMLLELDRLIRQSDLATCALLQPNHDICLLMRQIPLLISQSITPLQTMTVFVEKVVYMLYKSNTPFALEAYTGFLQSLFEMSIEVAKEATAWIVYADDERKYNAPVIAMLIRHEMLPLKEYDVQLAKLIYARADGVIDFAVDLIRICLLSGPITTLEDHILTVAMLHDMVKEKEAPDNVVALITDLEKQANAPYIDLKVDVNCLELRMLFSQWARICQHPVASDPMYRQLVTKILAATKDDNGRCLFFRLCIETLANRFTRRTIHFIDAFGKLVAYMVMMEGETKEAKVKLYGHALSTLILVLAKQHSSQGTSFNQKSFLRMLIAICTEVNKRQLKTIESSLLAVFSDALYTLQPARFPGFAFSWLQLVSHRALVPLLLVAKDNRGWSIYQKLVVALLQFLCPLLQKRRLQKATCAFYRGTLRFLVVLLHDFPEFLCEHYMVFAQLIPQGCIQLRNLVLSAFPRIMHLPDPFTPNLRLDLLPESKQAPSMVYNYAEALGPWKSKIDTYIKVPTPSFCVEALDHLKQADRIGPFVLYLGSQAALDEPMEKNAAAMVYKYLLTHMTSEDHLRYPNSHTYFFSTVLLYLFDDQPEQIKEQITRVLLERLIVNRPHPWGLLATFIELIQDPDFWGHYFVRCSPDIERLFDNVSKSIKRTAV
ncbi:hypothetical protein EC973_007207 [Apophysomyces ossiformis]|uniref:CCR4-Not complex component Not1 C-terminal domain-containing protein n=1 Tax=Apophysomyces ossiformis TaxID=679940 RepID=A0A8H7BPP5_9FUNG|nr:hypothetical protein EC973_007207 [Apophysomyces ossiformis]